MRSTREAQDAQKASGRAGCCRVLMDAEDASGRAPQNRRDRSQPAPRSVRFRLEIGRTIPGGADQPEDGKRPPNHYASTTRRAAAQTFSLLFYDFMAKHLLITTLHRRIPIILTIHIILGVNASQ